MRRPEEPPDRDILRTYFDDLLYLLRRERKGLAEAALRQVRLQRRDVTEATPRLCFDTFYALLSWVHTTQALTVPGLRWGLRRDLGELGIFGQALLASSCSGEALNLAQRFYGSAWRHVHLAVYRERDTVVSRYLPLPSAVCHPVPLAQAMTAMSVSITRELVPAFDPRQLEVRYAFPTPPDADAYREQLGCKVRFGASWHELRQPAHWLAAPRTPSAAVPRAPLHALGAWQRQLQPHDIVERVQALLQQVPDAGEFPTQQAVARHIGIAERTLRQWLAAHDTSFRALLLALRLERARGYLSRTPMSVAEVAALVGYRHAPSFHRAYRHHFGNAPREHDIG